MRRSSQCPADKKVLHLHSSKMERKNLKLNKDFVSTPTGGLHNHPKPIASPLSPLKKIETQELLDHGVAPGKIHMNMVMKAPSGEATSKDVPSLRSLYNNNYYRNKSSRPSADEVGNVIGSFGGDPKFLRKVILFPSIIIILATDMGLELLREHGKEYALTDGTFKLVRDKDLKHELVLWTIMVRLGGKTGPGIPCAYVITDSKEGENYVEIFSSLRRILGSWMPDGWLLDFEQAIENALRVTYPESAVYGDEFHFYKANIDWLNKNGGNCDLPILSPLLRFLAHSPRDQIMDDCEAFLTFWKGRRIDYASYFKNNWMQKHTPKKWALCFRPNDTPSGDQVLEAWHHRLQKVVFEDRLQRKLDDAVLLLYKEAIYQERIATSTDLLAIRQKATQNNSMQRERTKTLRDYVAGIEFIQLLRKIRYGI
jgi:hypothetical protein